MVIVNQRQAGRFIQQAKDRARRGTIARIVQRELAQRQDRRYPTGGMSTYAPSAVQSAGSRSPTFFQRLMGALKLAPQVNRALISGKTTSSAFPAGSYVPLVVPAGGVSAGASVLTTAGKGLSKFVSRLPIVPRIPLSKESLKATAYLGGLYGAGFGVYNINKAIQTGDPRDVIPTRGQLGFALTAPFNVFSAGLGLIRGKGEKIGTNLFGNVVDFGKKIDIPTVSAQPNYNFGGYSFEQGGTSTNITLPSFESGGGAPAPSINISAGGGGGDFGLGQALLLGALGGGVGGFLLGRRKRKKKRKYKKRKRR